MKSMLMLMAIAAASLAFTSCDDDPWDEPWHDPYGWYEDYNHGGWGWNQGSWNQGSHGSADDNLVAEAQTLVGEWYGPVTYSYIQDDGVSRGTDEFYADMIFYQSGSNADALSGNGVEIDYVYAEGGDVADQQTLKFAWYVDNNGDIYIRYDGSGATFVMDAGASQYGFNLGSYKGEKGDIFRGYMIGTGSVKGDVIYIDLGRVTSGGYNAKKLTRSASGAEAFGRGAACKPLHSAAGKQLNGRR